MDGICRVPYLVRRGMPAPEADDITERCVALAESTGTPLDGLTYKQLKGVDERFGEDVAEVFDYVRSVEMRAAQGGGTSKQSVLEQITELAKKLR